MLDILHGPKYTYKVHVNQFVAQSSCGSKQAAIHTFDNLLFWEIMYFIFPISTKPADLRQILLLKYILETIWTRFVLYIKRIGPKLNP